MISTENLTRSKFSISGVNYTCNVEPPSLIIYRRGYTAWRNDYVFPDYGKRSDYPIWLDNYVYKLVRFKEGDSIAEHASFMSSGIMNADFNRIPKFANAERDESIRAQPEIDNKRAEGDERVFIECLKSMGVGKQSIFEFCPTAGFRYDTYMQLMYEAKKNNSNIYKALNDFGIVITFEKNRSGQEQYYLTKNK